MKKKYGSCAAALAGLVLAYFVIRYPLLFLHRMHDIPMVLFLWGAIVCIVSGVAGQRKILPFFALAGYVLGFLLGCLFQADYGPENMAQNSLWIIWIFADLAIILAGVAAEIVAARRKRT